MWTYEVQKKGFSGDQVLAIQRALPTWAASELIHADGIFGLKTELAIKNYQLAKGIHSDGIVGKVTGSALGVWQDTELGFDASHWNEILWDQIPPSIMFANLKATEGQTYIDPISKRLHITQIAET